MNKHNAKDYKPFVDALAEGKTVSMQDANGNWIAWQEFEFSKPPECYRVEPTPRYRPWTLEEVPVGKVVALPCGSGRFVITAVEADEDVGVSILLGQCDEVNAEVLLANYFLLDGSPCGVTV